MLETHLFIYSKCWCFNVFCRDIASLDAYGYCRIEGRIKDLIIRGGENIYPAEIEQFLHTHPKIQEAQVSSNSKRLENKTKASLTFTRHKFHSFRVFYSQW